MSSTQTQRHIEALLQFCLRNGLLERLDIVETRNRLYSRLAVPPEEVDEGRFNVPDSRAENETATEILTALTDDYAARGFLSEGTVTLRDIFVADLMGLCMPRSSEIAKRFEEFYRDSPKKATDYFYALCRSVNYIQVDRIKNDMYWTAETEYGEMEITVNLSKPEKDPRDIIAAAHNPVSTGYPRCLLCLENVGFAGTRTHPARQNLRVIPVELEGEPWYFQYSPYSYYNEHCIVLSEEHTPMQMNADTFKCLIDFVKRFPHYFMGSNAGLPIVGGSILSHKHFQGGWHVFPMEKAAAYREITAAGFPGIRVALIKWPMSVIRLTVIEKDAEGRLIDAALRILNCWREYEEPQADIIAYTDGVPHNTVTPIARYNRDGRLEMDIVLRNNRTSEEFPLGIFHPHPAWHHVKKENIGLIEVMGLAVLPGRLRDEIEGNKISRGEIGGVFTNVLRDCGVFKDNETGREQFYLFLRRCFLSTFLNCS
jgi:UDPglucose--hexose-1-phosphate uridylyltransferase